MGWGPEVRAGRREAIVLVAAGEEEVPSPGPAQLRWGAEVVSPALRLCRASGRASAFQEQLKSKLGVMKGSRGS